MPTRRTILTAGLAAPAVAGSAARSALADGARTTRLPSLPDIEFSRREPFLNRERATRILADEGLDALLVGAGSSVYYATSFYPLLERMSYANTALALLPRDPARPVALIVADFSYYFVHADDGLVPGVQPFVFTGPEPGPDEGHPPAARPPRVYRTPAGEDAPEREQQRRRRLAEAAPYQPDMPAALARASQALGLVAARIGYDDASLAPLLARALPQAAPVASPDTLRRIRLVRTPAEIRMMRIAAQANVEAALATISVARQLGSLRAIRQQFFAEASLRGNLGVFMVVDGVASDVHDEPLREGQSFLIDCVSHCRHFHGDFGRTVFVGEPHRRIRACTDAMATTWAELQPALRPGLRFSQIGALGREILHKLGVDVPVNFNPHSVGFAHSDQPRRAPDGGPLDIVLEAGMILSVDCPLGEAGAGGTAHLEDLVLITGSGAVPIHDTGTPTYAV